MYLHFYYYSDFLQKRRPSGSNYVKYAEIHYFAQSYSNKSYLFNGVSISSKRVRFTVRNPIMCMQMSTFDSGPYDYGGSNDIGR